MIRAFMVSVNQSWPLAGELKVAFAPNRQLVAEICDSCIGQGKGPVTTPAGGRYKFLPGNC